MPPGKTLACTMYSGHWKPPIQADVLHLLGDVRLSHLSGKCADIISLGGLLGCHAILAGSSRHVDVSLQNVDFLSSMSVSTSPRDSSSSSSAEKSSSAAELYSSSSSSLEAAAKGELMPFKAVAN
jgi:hypothetical protein